LRLRIFNQKDLHSPSARDMGDIVNMKKISKRCLINHNNIKNDLSINNLDKFRARLGKLNREKTAIIRELHVYGKSLKLGEKGRIGQHIGLGKELMKKAEEIVKEKGIKKISVISGVGVREYYKKLGYVLNEEEGNYMVKYF